MLSEPELLEIQARLALAGKTLGGLVTTERLPDAYLKNRIQTEETRGHNWELLRQRAEANRLYFDPLGFSPLPNASFVVGRARGSVCRTANLTSGTGGFWASPILSTIRG